MVESQKLVSAVEPEVDLQNFLVEAIKRSVAESPRNRLRDIDGSPIFEEPLIGFTCGDNPLFQEYKKIISEDHLTPREALRLKYPDAEPEHVSTITWILPIARQTRISNRRETQGPSLRWNNTRFQGEDFNNDLRKYVVSLLEERGYLAIAPALPEILKNLTLANGPASNWSERHVAYIAGLGTFSLTDAFITEKGITHRCGSVVTNAHFSPGEKVPGSHVAYCPFLNDGSCGVCIDRCPGGAITPQGHDKNLCRKIMFEVQKPWLEGAHGPGYIGAYAGCGLCLTKVPCEAGIPRATGIKRESRLSNR